MCSPNLPNKRRSSSFHCSSAHETTNKAQTAPCNFFGSCAANPNTAFPCIIRWSFRFTVWLERPTSEATALYDRRGSFWIASSTAQSEGANRIDDHHSIQEAEFRDQLTFQDVRGNVEPRDCVASTGQAGVYHRAPIGEEARVPELANSVPNGSFVRPHRFRNRTVRRSEVPGERESRAVADH